jgi:protein-S-isoprenylcysteine O-methyltransferase Ste14
MWATIALRAYLLGGLLGHKLVWEAMKRRDPLWREIPPESPERHLLLIKVAKTAFLAAIILQTLLPDPWAAVLPIAQDPGPIRVAGVLLYGIGVLTAILGRVQLGRNWADIERAGVHSQQQLVSRGVYGRIRHPIYTGDLLLLIGLELALNSWFVLVMITLALIVSRQAAREEEKLARTLSGYDEYRRRTKRFIPFVY